MVPTLTLTLTLALTLTLTLTLTRRVAPERLHPSSVSRAYLNPILSQLNPSPNPTLTLT